MSTPAVGRRRGRWPRWTAAAVGVAVVAAIVATVTSSDAVSGGAGATTTGAPTTAAAATTTPPPSLPPPADEASDPVRAVVPGIVAIEDELTAVAERQPVVATALTDGTHNVAIPTPPGTLCAVVPVTAPLMAAGRWERDGETVAEVELFRRDPPGYGDCIVADDIGELEAGAYQYVAVGESGATSAVATIVVGVPSVVVWLLNDGDEAVCLVQTSPLAADFYDAYQTDSELVPGEALAIGVAAIEQDVRVYGCPPDDVVRSFDLVPQAGVYVELFGGEQPEDSTPGVSAASTVRPIDEEDP